MTSRLAKVLAAVLMHCAASFFIYRQLLERNTRLRVRCRPPLNKRNVRVVYLRKGKGIARRTENGESRENGRFAGEGGLRARKQLASG